MVGTERLFGAHQILAAFVKLVLMNVWRDSLDRQAIAGDIQRLLTKVHQAAPPGAYQLFGPCTAWRPTNMCGCCAPGKHEENPSTSPSLAAATEVAASWCQPWSILDW